MTTSHADLLRRAGTLLFGQAWQPELARALGINRRTIERWMAGSREPGEETWAEITELLFEHRDDLADLLQELALRERGAPE